VLGDDATARYMNGIWSHLDKQTGMDLPGRREAMSYLCVEDFGTRGLCGNYHQFDDPEEGGEEKNDFYYFWRNVGRSKKSDNDRGRWGLGKTVFPAVSRINSYFGITVRAEDQKRLLMGQSVLKLHKIRNQRRSPYGYFGKFDDDGFPLPIEAGRFIDQFCSDFRVQRGNGTGLSVVIPYPEKDLSHEGVLQSSIRHYFYPIMAGHLIVEVVRDGRLQTVTAEKIRDVAERLSWPDGDQGHSRLRRRANAPTSATPDTPRTCVLNSTADPNPLILVAQGVMDFDAFALPGSAPREAARVTSQPQRRNRRGS
jgi:hypothetical protein